jgi:uncharacterized protein YndB with AHSA1/START domain
MLVVSRKIHIKAPVERVFTLLADPAARIALWPQMRSAQVQIEGGGPLRRGSICRFRLQAGDRLLAYRTQVRELVPNRRIVSVSDSQAPFEVTLETEADTAGTWLTHTERFEPSEAMLRAALRQTPSSTALEKIYEWLPFLDPEYATRARQGRERILVQQLEGSLEQWLAAIKRHLESA